MDAEALLLSLELASGSGLGLSPERRAALLTSLLLLRRDYRYQRVLFWGRILGLTADYYIAQGLGPDQLGERKTLYSLNCMEWCLLPPATEKVVTQTSVVKGRFMGDPSHEYDHTEVQKVEEGDKTYEEEVVIQIKEEARLVATIDQIDKAVAIVPRGALVKTPLGPVHVNRSFEGARQPEDQDSAREGRPGPRRRLPGFPGTRRSQRLLEHPDGKGQLAAGAAEPALARPDLLPRPPDQELRLLLRGHGREKYGSALHAVSRAGAGREMTTDDVFFYKPR
ncbi:radial spoke head protein 9 homolog isoform X1 [Tachyglossus aculeatus]|uniref:radial spoke head protein 9 homolog isoform X1 n=1 Tax=Tachyglossus aculeatus TaxID=9261 RepID=UPI0018F46F0E|nr:radial spoke head protein 9 homolog isoform X1 [Tachyglossus aculeatus]